MRFVYNIFKNYTFCCTCIHFRIVIVTVYLSVVNIPMNVEHVLEIKNMFLLNSPRFDRWSRAVSKVSIGI